VIVGRQDVLRFVISNFRDLGLPARNAHVEERIERILNPLSLLDMSGPVAREPQKVQRDWTGHLNVSKSYD
jgi:hypothetical protein